MGKLITKTPSSPLAYGIPKPLWRPHQREAVEKTLTAIAGGTEVIGLGKPTGSGKTVVAMALARHFVKHYQREDGRPTRVVILVGTNTLFPMYEDLGAIGVKGMRHYPCLALAKHEFPAMMERQFNPSKLADPRCDLGPCLVGHHCTRRTFESADTCDYFTALKRYKQAAIGLTNYALHLLQPDDDIDLLICDEAHGIMSHLDSAAILEHPKMPSDWRAAKEWARDRLAAIVGVKTIEGIRERDKLARLIRVTNPDNWKYIPGSKRSSGAWAPVKLTDEADALMNKAKHVVLLSATLSESDVRDLVAVASRKRRWDFTEYPSPFPAYRRPLVHIPMVSIKQGMSGADTRALFAAMDRIIEYYSGQGWKGIIHSASYQWGRDFMAATRFKALAHFPTTSKDVPAMLAKFKASPKGFLLSPSVTTGLDFPMDECRYQIILKMPFPSKANPLVEARTLIDSSYGTKIALATLTQALGRGMRSVDDWCDTIILDKNLSWVLWSPTSGAQKWVKDAYRKAGSVEEWIKMRKGETR